MTRSAIRPARPDRAQAEQAVRDWNYLHRVGVAVRVHRDNGAVLETRTRSDAQLLGGHTAVVWVEGIAGAYALDRVEPVEPADRVEAEVA